MDRNHEPLVIAIAGISGGGKTTMVTQLANRLENAKALFFDEYELEGPDDLVDWAERGNNYDEWNLAPFAGDVKSWIGEPIKYLLLDFPFAYRQSQMRGLIDVAIFIDTPLDVALARRINRDFQRQSGEEMLAYIKYYADHGRRAYLEMLETIKPGSDWVVDGMQPIEALVSELAERIDRLSSELVIRKMNHSDCFLVSQWLSTPEVLEFYGGVENPLSPAQVEAKYGPRIDGEVAVYPFIIERNNKPIGFMQCYKLQQDLRKERRHEADSAVYGIDQFIGIPSFFNQGIGTAMVESFTDFLFDSTDAQIIGLDPDVSNHRAIRCYEKCGFRKVKKINNGEEWWMKLSKKQEEETVNEVVSP